METLYTMKDTYRYNLIKESLDGLLTIPETAKRLHLSERQVKRLRKCILEEGLDGVVHGNRGAPSPRAIPEELRKQIVNLKKSSKYVNTNFKHFQDLLAEREDIKISYTALHNILRTAGITSKRKHRTKQVHRLRSRRDYFGELIQADATFHDWLRTGQKITLHGMIDDATGIPVGLHFCEHECLFGYLEVTRQMLTNYGIPAELYPDKHSVFFPTAKQNQNLSIEEQLAGKTSTRTQFGAIMDELGVDMYPAPTAEAKGRIERLWNTLQDRLLEEMRIDDICTIEEANAYLPIFLERYIRRFAVTPKEAESKFIAVPDYLDLDLLLAMRFTRKLDRAGSFSLQGKRFQVLNNRIAPGAKVAIYMSKKIGVVVLYKNKRYAAICVDDLPGLHTTISFEKFCKEHSVQNTAEFIAILLDYDAKQHDPLLINA